MFTGEIDSITPLVARVMAIDDVTTGDPQKTYSYRYRGRLRGDSETAYDQLASSLRPRGFTPLFRNEGGQHVILLMQGTINPQPSNPLVNLVMFLLTLASVILAGALYAGAGEGPAGLQGVGAWLLGGLPFAGALLAILLAHEFGHYLAGRYHKVHVTLPYFIPLPFFSPFGTMGAFIQLKEPPKNKRILLDIGIAGPLAGLVVAIPVLLLGLSLSELNTLDVAPGMGLQLEGNSILYLFLKWVIFGQLLPNPISFGDLGPVAYWLRYFFTGQPVPLGGIDVLLHPVAMAGWAGLLVTALNLIPAGQFDGGHLIYVLLGSNARKLWPFIMVALLGLGFIWPGWWLWAALIFLLGRVNAEPLDQITPLNPRRRLIAFAGLVIFILVFMPVPMVLITPGG